MRNKLWLVLAPMMMLGLAACGEDTASTDEPATPPAAEAPGAAGGTTTPPPATGTGTQ
ncbi:hypothetical protein IGS68_20695 [Skermanella sp. TT6]|uniref:Uncharacterized protein n=1 Tax=Skermanella cutis TaxID=2775420 RepID=A0ABX7B5P5_9PROT|nr:hypothetical protein [Skermanella sp. TT6]QQP88440.1 hypothetical protein IGS68_20695 [Skermanella sp. TT6]